ncbi:MAG: hypothetical protein HYY45_09725 [Deltaproteobacteria bacterium]|nr:hypothetical protein [Deltaproteobacteria bacterium]
MSERERELEASGDPEAEDNHYEVQFRYVTGLVAERRKGKRIVKWEETHWQQGRQGLLRFYCNPGQWHELAAPGWTLFHQQVLKHSGKHIHQGGLPIYVVQGSGYSVIDGVRYNWKKGDLLCLPFKRGGVEHQHFNEDPDNPPVWIALRFMVFQENAAGDLIQVETHPDWNDKKK